MKKTVLFTLFATFCATTAADNLPAARELLATKPAVNLPAAADLLVTKPAGNQSRAVELLVTKKVEGKTVVLERSEAIASLNKPELLSFTSPTSPTLGRVTDKAGKDIRVSNKQPNLVALVRPVSMHPVSGILKVEVAAGYREDTGVDTLMVPENGAETVDLMQAGGLTYHLNPEGTPVVVAHSTSGVEISLRQR